MSANDANVNFRSVSSATDRPQVLNAGIVKAGLLTGNQSVLGGLIEKTFVGYTPVSGSWGGTALSGVYLNTTPGLAATSSSAVNLVLPVGSVIKAVQVVKDSTALVGGPFNVALTTSTAGPVTEALVVSGTIARCNTGAGIIVQHAAPAGAVLTVADNRITAYGLGAAVTAGNAVVYLSVLVPNA